VTDLSDYKKIAAARKNRWPINKRQIHKNAHNRIVLQYIYT